MAAESKKKGDISEVEALRYYLGYDWTVSIPFGDNARFDLVVHPKKDQRESFRVQVKTLRRKSPETLYADLTSNTGARGKKSRYSCDEVDEFFLFWPGDESQGPTCYRAPVDKVRDRKNPDLVQSSIRLRTGGTGRKNSRWAKDFEAKPALPQEMDKLREFNRRLRRLRAA